MRPKRYYMDSTGLINSEDEWINKFLDHKVLLSKLYECVEVRSDRQCKKWKPVKKEERCKTT